MLDPRSHWHNAPTPELLNARETLLEYRPVPLFITVALIYEVYLLNPVTQIGDTDLKTHGSFAIVAIQPISSVRIGDSRDEGLVTRHDGRGVQGGGGIG
jgi:hypothetical protein